MVLALGMCTHSKVVGFLDLPPNMHWSSVMVSAWVDDSSANVSGSLHVDEQCGIQYGVAGCSMVAGIPSSTASIMKSRLTRSSAFPVYTCCRSCARNPLYPHGSAASLSIRGPPSVLSCSRLCLEAVHVSQGGPQCSPTTRPSLMSCLQNALALGSTWFARSRLSTFTFRP